MTPDGASHSRMSAQQNILNVSHIARAAHIELFNSITCTFPISRTARELQTIAIISGASLSSTIQSGVCNVCNKVVIHLVNKFACSNLSWGVNSIQCNLIKLRLCVCFAFSLTCVFFVSDRCPRPDVFLKSYSNFIYI